jgi:hypothetical protein
LTVQLKDYYVKAGLKQTEVQALLKAEWPQCRVHMVSGVVVIAKPSVGNSSMSGLHFVPSTSFIDRFQLREWFVEKGEGFSKMSGKR